jgi:ribosome biogenesis GTPase
MMPGSGAERLEGIVIQKSSRDVRIETAQGILVSTFRGRFRQQHKGGSFVVAGDRVEVSRVGESEGVLERILPRRTEVTRATAGGKPIVVAANMDRLLVVLAARDPPPRWALVDRMLVSAHRDSLEPAIALNKWDQAEMTPSVVKELEEILDLYRGLGYPAFALSALNGSGLDKVIEWLRGKSTAFSGHSGVGKSTLLNALDPSLGLQTGDVNVVTGKGRHITTAVRLFKLPFGGHAADTPGFREFQPVALSPGELGRHYPELRAAMAGCRYKDCLHRSEPSCAVRDAVSRGGISKMRYDNYLQILTSLLEMGKSSAF